MKAKDRLLKEWYIKMMHWGALGHKAHKTAWHTLMRKMGHTKKAKQSMLRFKSKVKWRAQTCYYFNSMQSRIFVKEDELLRAFIFHRAKQSNPHFLLLNDRYNPPNHLILLEI